MSNERKHNSEKLLEIHPQPTLDHLVSNSLEFIDENTTFNTKLIFTFANAISDISQNSCTKMDLARRFQLIIQQKQRKIRDQVGKINSKNLVYLQEKSNTIGKKNKIINDLKEQIKENLKFIQKIHEEKVQLQSIIQSNIKEFSEKEAEIDKFKQIEKKLTKKLQQMTFKHDQLFAKVQYEEEVRIKLKNQLNKYEFNQQNWEQRIQFLLQSRQHSLTKQYQQKIELLSQIIKSHKEEILQLKNQNQDVKTKYNLLKDEILYSLQSQKSTTTVINNNQKPRFILKIHKQVQTLQSSIKMVDFAVNIAIECQQCKMIANVAKYMKNLSIHNSTQTQQIIKYFCEEECQTSFKFLQPDEEMKLIQNIKSLKQIVFKKQQISEEKQIMLLQIIENTPSREDDLIRILSLQNQCQHLKLDLAFERNEIISLKKVNKALFSNIEDMKLHEDGNIQISSKQYKSSKNNYQKAKTLPFFYDKFTQNISIVLKNNDFKQQKNTSEYDLKNDKIALSQIFRNKRLKTADGTRDSSRSFAKSNKFNQIQNKTISDFQFKVKNPEYFSANPNINLKRRQYKKYSLMKAKK